MDEALSLLVCHILAQLDHLTVILIHVSVHVELTLRSAWLVEVRRATIPAFRCWLLQVLLLSLLG